MSAVEMYLVRGPDGRMSTVNARSPDGAKRAYLEMPRKRKLKRGDNFSVKPRNHGDWTHYKVM